MIDDPIIAEFDTELLVAQYRAAVEMLENQTTELGRHEFKAIADRLRKRWVAWQGENSLHEMAFGEPGDA